MDAAGLLAAAARIEELAALVRARAVLVGVHTSTMRWHSPASRVFFARLDDVCATLVRCAARLDELADLTRQAAR
jgi:hypothetical protein